MQSATLRAPYQLGPLPLGRAMETVDQQLVRASPHAMFQLARDVEQWPAYLAHYRYVRFRERSRDGGGLVEMSANRPFGLMNWPTWWLSEMSVDDREPAIRFRHVGGITKGMDVEWQFTRRGEFAHVRIVHVWDGPRWPFVGIVAARRLIGPVFIHGIASRTLAGLAAVAEREALRTAGPGGAA
ncbi:MAG TPA: SRPBCC family protein [Gemmatimonadaceae bacterium]|nr:SRPBCC family protein [Gemmatimonadaceae bacterium]